jgi:purine-binding chemotaxis protein CheW
VLGEHAITRVPLAPAVIQGLINLRGQIVTVFDVRRCCRLPPAPEGTPRMGVVVRLDDRVVCLLVDEIGDVVQVDRGAFEWAPETVPAEARRLIRGAYKLKDALVLELDIDMATRIDPDSQRLGRGNEPPVDAH